MIRHGRSSRARSMIHGAALITTILWHAGLAPVCAGADSDFALPVERPADPPAEPARETAASVPVVFGRFASVQVNVNASGANIVGDAANEPSIAVDPLDHDRMAIGWRQFDSNHSNFRQAGYAYTVNGGQSWTAGKIQPGTFRSDPVLDVDSDGDFFYLSLDQSLKAHLFPSLDHGMTWGAAVSARGGDKPWIAFDQSAGPGRDHAYHTWSTTFPNAPNLNRSLDDGLSFGDSSLVPGVPGYGTLDVADDGTLYIVGTNTGVGGAVVARSTNARDGVTPTFTTSFPDLGGTTRGGVQPNLEGLLGQYWIAVDKSPGPQNGWVYVLASVLAPPDPLDVHFIRSTDGGATWSAPIRINDDPSGTRAFQWFGMMSVAPDGRIDAAWNDTRGGTDSTISAVYYSYSADGGLTWSPNEQVTPTWNCTLGYPNQKKIGDYDHMVSDATGADLAYAATFNGEEDVYYVRLSPPVASVTERSPASRLWPALPNPLSSSTTVRFEVPAGGARVRLDVLDVTGRRVARLAEGWLAGGTHTARWTAQDAHGMFAAPGVYFCRYAFADHVETQRWVVFR